ncbi:MAG: triose-phosphate isomerase [Gammaproteobacteria bacterium]
MITSVANWKLNGSDELFREWFREFKKDFNGDFSKIAIAPPTLYIPLCNELGEDKITVCAQNLDFSNAAARTGEVSLEMLLDMQCSMSIVGHSERRNIFGETSEMIHSKLKKIAGKNFIPIYCIGESLDEYNSNKSFQSIETQLNSELLLLREEIKIYIAYEPIWAIGTGKLPSINEIEKMHEFIKKMIASYQHINLLGMLYGGSVSPDNSPELSRSRLIDGVLVGGASLNGNSFAKIASSFS